MRRTTGKLGVVCIALVMLAACRVGNPIFELDKPDPGKADLAQVQAYGAALLQVAHAEYPRSGFSAAIVSRDDVLWSGSVGVMTGTGAAALPVTPELPMHVGSITKIFTALAVMQLVEQGKLDLDANLRTYIPEFHINSRFGNGDFTLRQMLTHYSGLPSDLLDDFNNESAATRSLFASTVARTAQTHLKSKPDFAHSYSNLAFSLLGIVIERVSGEHYDDYLRRHLFAPLQMTQSAVLVPDADGNWPLEQAPEDPRQLGYEPIGGLAAGAIVSSLNDMTRFAQMLLAEGAGIVTPESFREMQRVQDRHVTLGGGNQGLPFQLSFPPTAAQFSSGHTGALPGHYAHLRFFPDQDLAIVVMETSDDDIANKVDWLGVNLRDVALEFVAPGSSREPPKPEPARAVRVTQTPGEAARYAGLYFAVGLGLVEVANDDGELTLRPDFTRLVKAKLKAAGNDTFVPGVRVLGFIPLSPGFVGLENAELHFVFDGDRRYITLATNGAPPQPLAASLAPGDVNAVWRRRFGIYQPEDRGGTGLLAKVTLKLDAEHGIAMADARTGQGQQLNLALELLSNSEAAIAGVGRYTGEVIEFVSDDEFVFEGTRFKRI